MEAVIGRDGAVTELSVISGHPLLQQAALTAVSQWRYELQFLHGEPIEVSTKIDVVFSLIQ